MDLHSVEKTVAIGKNSLGFRMKTILAVLALAVPLFALAGGRGMLVLQCGSDWCDSGEDVRCVFESPEFRRLVGGRFELAVYDDMENPTPKVKSANARLERLRVASRRFPAITCLTDEPRRLFAQLENIPFDVSAKGLADMVSAAAKNKDDALKLFKRGRGKSQPAADALGRGFELLESQIGEFDRQFLREGPLAWSEQWSHLEEIDADDRFGWRRRFTMGYGVELVEKASSFGRCGDTETETWAEFEKSLAAIPTNNLAVVQRQCLAIVPYAYAHGSESGADSVSPSEIAMFRRVVEMGRDTVWGQYALGKLALAGENVERLTPFRAELISRPEPSCTVSTPFKLREVEERIENLSPGEEGFSEADKRNIALYAVLRRIGEPGWDGLRARSGAVKFMRAFFGDRKWMEDFAWSGSCTDWPGAVLALESLCFQDNGRWIDGDGPGRRFATASALEKPTTDEAWLADWLDAYRTTALAKRLHKSALQQDVWLWRYAVNEIHNREDPPTQQRILDRFYNVSVNRMADAMWLVPYRFLNCFGASVHGPHYYEPWETAGEWTWCRYAYIVGGVCGQLSHFASRCSNAHGLPSVPVGQPGHCAFTRRLPDGSWVIDNFIKPPTGFPALWPGLDNWTYSVATEATFVGEREKRLEADRYLELAHLAEARGRDAAAVNCLYRRACSSWPRHCTAWREYGAWIVRARRPLAEHKSYAQAAARELVGMRHPLWDLLTPYFSHVARECGNAALAGELADFAPLLRQGDEEMRDNGDISVALREWTRPLESDAALMEKTVVAFVSAQYGTRNFFTQTLGWCAGFLFEDEARAGRFMKLLPKLAEKFAKSLRGMKGKSTKELAEAAAAAKSARPDLGPFILAAEDSGDIAAFQRFSQMQEKIGRQSAGLAYKKRDFDGEIVSGDGMLTLQSSAPGDTPDLHKCTIDASGAKDFTFCALAYKGEPAATVVLAGPCEVRGIVLSLACPDKAASESQLPIEVEISEDGAGWQKVFEADKLRNSYRIEFKSNRRPRARYVRVRRLAGKDGTLEQVEYFRMSKIVVYGKKLY